MRRKNKAPRYSPGRSLQEIHDRLSARPGGRQAWARLTRLLCMLPQARIFFVKQFGQRTIAQVLRQVDQWREWIQKDFVISADQKAAFETELRCAETLAWNALIEANLPFVGEWRLEVFLLPTEQYENREFTYLRPGLQIAAYNKQSGERRQAVIPGEIFNDVNRRSAGWKDAFQQLGLWQILWNGSVHQRLVSARKPQGWPLFTEIVIPTLYDILIPFYQKAGHHSTPSDERNPRLAFFPQELFEDMAQILNQLRPDFSVSTTKEPLIAVVQRYLDRKAEITKSQGYARKWKEVILGQANRSVR